MRSKRLRIRSEAWQEIAEAFEWYLARSTEAAGAFLDEIEESLRLIVSHPRLYPAYTANTRRRVLERFPYSVVYREKDDVLLVIAVAHVKRRPGYWKRRD